MSPIENAISYFVGRKFGFVAVIATSMASMNSDKINVYAE